ncbi:restriction endonuclease [Teichococcus oryzae]|uniref:restriction endonuclease n=1 Tax=Teichococcus oryzae TaxID=1608942 RepID=UPI0013763912|nr:restriction endonuclease [Pseudoroseomonas oryzae]
MTGLAFERATAAAFENLGWTTKLTQASGDFGADVIAHFGTTSIVIQCKYYKDHVGLSAVQQAFTAQRHFKADMAIVVARSGFTRAAKTLAESTGVKLVRLSDLKRHCEFDRSVEAARARQEHEAREKARKERALAAARERRAREEAEARERLARQAREAREREAAAARARAAAEEERRARQARSDWQDYDKAVGVFEGKREIYKARWAYFLLPVILAAAIMIPMTPRPGLGVVFLAAAAGAGLYWFLFVVSKPGTWPVRPSMPRPAGMLDPHAGKADRQAAAKDASFMESESGREGPGKVIRWCPGCSTGLRLPMRKEGTVRCRACGDRFWART